MMRVERELACDELVLNTIDEDETNQYGQTILESIVIKNHMLNAAGALAFGSTRKQLKRRITMISSTARKPSTYKRRLRIFIVVFGV